MCIYCTNSELDIQCKYWEKSVSRQMEVESIPSAQTIMHTAKNPVLCHSPLFCEDTRIDLYLIMHNGEPTSSRRLLIVQQLQISVYMLNFLYKVYTSLLTLR